MPWFHWPDLLIIVAFGALLFGSKKLPELTRSIGKGISEFKKSVSEIGENGKKEAQPIPEPLHKEP